MTPTQYIKLRKQLGLSNYALAPILGVSLRQAQRYEAGEAPIPLPVAKLLTIIERYKIPTLLVWPADHKRKRPHFNHKDGVE
jgi:DNA-binding transcriptional regulator YiaG